MYWWIPNLYFWCVPLHQTSFLHIQLCPQHLYLDALQVAQSSRVQHQALTCSPALLPPACPPHLPRSSQSWQPHPNSYLSLKPGNHPLLVPSVHLVSTSHWLDLQNTPGVWLPPLPRSLIPTSLAWIIWVASTCCPFFLLHPWPLYSQHRSRSDTSHRNQTIQCVSLHWSTWSAWSNSPLPSSLPLSLPFLSLCSPTRALNMPWALPPQAFTAGCSLCLEHSSSRCLHGVLPHFLHSFSQNEPSINQFFFGIATPSTRPISSSSFNLLYSICLHLTILLHIKLPKGQGFFTYKWISASFITVSPVPRTMPSV